jgi:hypothetical protein
MLVERVNNLLPFFQSWRPPLFDDDDEDDDWLS